jgi:uncharacterized protein (DUF169 family)
MAPSTLTSLLNLDSTPVAIAFVDSSPTGVPHVATTEPASCGYWRRAEAGEIFFTTPHDHKCCPVGAHTHHVALTSSEQDRLMSLVKTMVDLSYLTMEDVAKIPRRRAPFQCAVYAPLSLAPVPPDVILVRGNARQLMLLAEAAESGGIASATPAMGRPTCAILPESINSDRTAVSFGCVGNRVYTEAADDDAYFAIPGPQLAALEQSLVVIVRANEALRTFHESLAGAMKS